MRSSVELAQHYPKISIVTPSFNQAEFLEATIQSILSQNYPNLEYIVIDGGSTDRSVEIIQKYEPHLHFWCSEPDDGQYDAINKGFAQATGEILAWLNSDDVYYPWTLKTVASVMAALPQVEWLTSLQHGVWDQDGFCLGFKPILGYSRASFLDGCHLYPLWKNHPSKFVRGQQRLRNLAAPSYLGFIQQESTFWRRQLWQKIGQISPQFPLAGDFDVWSQFFRHSEVHTIASPLAGFRRRPDQKSAAISAYVNEAIVSLTTLRKESHYSPNYLKFLGLRSRLYHYTGQKIVRNSSQNCWEIQNYSFS